MNDILVSLREKLLHRVLRVDPETVLNPPETSRDEFPGEGSLDQAITTSLNRIRAEAVSEDGRQVDYLKLAQSPTYREFRKLVNYLDRFDYHTLNSREARLGFWINLYNALVVDAVIQENVTSSVTESWLGIVSFFQKAAYRVGGDRFSLTDIEHGVLRANSGFPYFPGPQFSPNDPRLASVTQPMDARIHFALNCASKSCPPIGVYSPDWIDQQLDLAAKSFINADTVLDIKNQLVSISMIFRWYWADFGGKAGILNMLGKYLDHPDDTSKPIPNLNSFRIKFHPYDWGLNIRS